MRSSFTRYATAVALAGMGLAAGLPLRSLIGARVPYLTFFFATLISAALGGFGPGVLTALLGTLLASRFILPGTGLLGLSNPADPTAAVRFLLVGITVSYICGILVSARENARCAQAAERNARLQFEQVLGGIADAVISTDVSGEVVLINFAAARLTGYNISVAKGKQLASVLELEGSASTGLVAQVLAAKAVISFPPDSLLKVDGKHLNVEGNASPVTDESGTITGVVVTFRDVTQRKQNDRLLAFQADELMRSNRELEQFAYVASHDLQEPLRMVNTFTELYLRKLGNQRTVELEQIASVIREGILRMNDLIKDLLSFSRVGHDVASQSAIDPRLALNDAIAVCGPLILETSAEINCAEMPMVLAQRSQLAQVFQNLVTNAIKYRSDGVHPRINITTQLRDSEVLFAIEDNGIGFEQAYAESIFGLFKRLNPTRYPGTGLGLAISQKIVERSHGRIWAESSPGKGARFSFTLPAA